MRNIIITLFLFFTVINISFSQEDSGYILDENGAQILSEDGKKIYSEYVEVCRDKGKFVKCPKDGKNNGFISRKIQRRCRNMETGKFIKCPQ